MKKFYILLFAIVSYSNVFGQTQTTVTFKPGPDIGHDAYIWTTGNCMPNGDTQLPANRNFGNDPRIQSVAWTWSALGCFTGAIRSLLKFDELSTIPANAEIISAELKLYGVPSSTGWIGNSCYPGSPYTSNCPNRTFIQRVTSAWEEQTVTWNTQPTTTTVNQITIPQTTSQYNWNFTDNSANLVAMIQEMVANPASNFGFMIKLETENHYRSLMFASSNYSNSALWPELTVTYKDCQTEPIIINETVILQDTITIHNTVVLHDTLTIYDTLILYDTVAIHDTIIIHDIVYIQSPCLCGQYNNVIKVYSNSTVNGWIVEITTEKEETIRVQLLDMTGQIIYSDTKILISGENSFVVTANSITAGEYKLLIMGKTINFSKTILKK